jgi:hypothetical protein
MPDSIRGENNFGADHYRPQKYFPELAATYTNLYYCCNTCNSFKSSHWPGKGKSQPHLIPNPCDDEMFKHLRFKRESVEAKSPAGNFAKDLLDLNDPDILQFRETILVAIDAIAKQQMDLNRMARNVQLKRSKGLLTVAEADMALAKVSEKIEETTRSLLRLGGEVPV